MATDASFKKRMIAYIIDILIVSIIFAGIELIIPENKNVSNLTLENKVAGEKFLKNELTFQEYYNQVSVINHDIDKERTFINVINVVILIGYFSVLSFYLGGQTPGQKLVHIKVISADNGPATLNELILRNLIFNGVLFTIISLACVFVLPSLYYFSIAGFFGILQIILVIISIFMIIYRQDKKGIHDLLAKTKVINVEKGVLLCEN